IIPVETMPSTLVVVAYANEPSSTLATSFNCTMEPSLGFVLTIISSKSSSEDKSESVITGYSNTCELCCGGAPTEPPGIRKFCSAIALETSAGGKISADRESVVSGERWVLRVRGISDIKYCS